MTTTSKITQGIQNIPHSVKIAILIIIVAKILVFTIGIVVTYLNTGLSSPFTAVIDMFNRWDAPHYVDIRKCYVRVPIA